MEYEVWSIPTELTPSTKIVQDSKSMWKLMYKRENLRSPEVMPVRRAYVHTWNDVLDCSTLHTVALTFAMNR